MAIRPVQDIGGLGRLAQTIQIRRAQDAEKQQREGQLETDRALTTGFSKILSDQGQFGPNRPINVRSAELAAETPGASLSDLSNLLKLGQASQGAGIKKVPFQKGTNTLVKVGEETFISTPVFNANTGTIENVRTPLTGEVLSRLGLTPQDTSDLAVTTAGKKKFAEMSGSSRSQSIDKGFETVQKLSKNILNIDDAIEAVKEGANTGVIARRFPTIQGAGVLLDNIQGRLALDVIGAVTFGALSKGELDLAKEIALPTGLEGPALIQYLTNRKAAQTKLLNYFQDQIEFLDKGGSVAGFLREKRRENNRAKFDAAKPNQSAQPTASPVDTEQPAQVALPEGVTEDDITTTMEANNMSRDEVLAKLGVK